MKEIKNEDIRKLIVTKYGDSRLGRSNFGMEQYPNIIKDEFDVITWNEMEDGKIISYKITRLEKGFKIGRWKIEGRYSTGINNTPELFHEYEFGFDEFYEVVKTFSHVTENSLKKLKIKYD